MRNKHDGEAIKKFIRKNPNMSWVYFSKNSRWSKIPNSVFRYYRDHVRKETKNTKYTDKSNGNSDKHKNGEITSRKYRRSSQRIYTTLWSANLEELGEQGKDAIFKLISDLKEEKIVNWEVVAIQGLNTTEIEIREKTR